MPQGASRHPPLAHPTASSGDRGAAGGLRRRAHGQRGVSRGRRPRRAPAVAGWRQGGCRAVPRGGPRRSDRGTMPPRRPPALAHLHLRPFSVIVNRTLGAFSPTVRSNAAMCSRSATDLLTSRSFVPLPRGTFHHRSHKLLGSSIPSWRCASAHARHDSARATGGRWAVRFNGLLAELGACPHAETPRPRPARAGTDIARCPSVPRGVRASRSENREFIRRVFRTPSSPTGRLATEAGA
jgi:hypothetical protein